jgi:hypothetical protein
MITAVPESHATLTPATAGTRLTWLYLVSRRVPAATGLLVALGGLLWSALHWHWNIAGGAAAQIFISLSVESGAAAVIAVSSHSSFSENERATGRWLPWLRLGTALALTAVAYGALAAGATGGSLPGGDLAVLRNLAGITGTGMIAAALVGGAFGWAGPFGYLLLTEAALEHHMTTPWIWPGRPSGDLGGALCASAVFAVGVVAVTVWAARSRRDGLRTGSGSPAPPAPGGHRRIMRPASPCSPAIPARAAARPAASTRRTSQHPPDQPAGSCDAAHPEPARCAVAPQVVMKLSL